MTETALDALAYFSPEAAPRRPGVSMTMIADAERRMGVTLPPSMRELLLAHNGLGLTRMDVEVLGVEDPADLRIRYDHPGAALSFWENYAAEGWGVPPRTFLPVAFDGSGDAWVVQLTERDGRGEHPVLRFDHETGEAGVYAASSYERFLWFLLHDLRRHFDEDGDSAVRRGVAPSEHGKPWPYGPLDWILAHDPDLARWRTE